MQYYNFKNIKYRLFIVTHYKLSNNLNLHVTFDSKNVENYIDYINKL